MNQSPKYCAKCETYKNKTDFNKNKARLDGLQAQCRECTKKKSKKHYKLNASKHKLAVAKNKNLYIALAKNYVIEYLKEHPCVDCKESDLVVLDFDHVSDVKENNISRMVYVGCSLTKIKLEIAKCEVRCANCHRRKTAKQFDWYKVQFLN